MFTDAMVEAGIAAWDRNYLERRTDDARLEAWSDDQREDIRAAFAAALDVLRRDPEVRERIARELTDFAAYHEERRRCGPLCPW